MSMLQTFPIKTKFWDGRSVVEIDEAPIVSVLILLRDMRAWGVVVPLARSDFTEKCADYKLRNVTVVFSLQMISEESQSTKLCFWRKGRWYALWPEKLRFLYSGQKLRNTYHLFQFLCLLANWNPSVLYGAHLIAVSVKPANAFQWTASTTSSSRTTVKFTMLLWHNYRKSSKMKKERHLCLNTIFSKLLLKLVRKVMNLFLHTKCIFAKSHFGANH